MKKSELLSLIGKSILPYVATELYDLYYPPIEKALAGLSDCEKIGELKCLDGISTKHEFDVFLRSDDKQAIENKLEELLGELRVRMCAGAWRDGAAELPGGAEERAMRTCVKTRIDTMLAEHCISVEACNVALKQASDMLADMFLPTNSVLTRVYFNSAMFGLDKIEYKFGKTNDADKLDECGDAVLRAVYAWYKL